VPRCYDRYATLRPLLMAKGCFIKKGSNPPVCGVHNVRLIEHLSVENRVLSKLGDFVFLVCPISGAVVDDDEEHP
jgi:hypothetical protein